MIKELERWLDKNPEAQRLHYRILKCCKNERLGLSIQALSSALATLIEEHFDDAHLREAFDRTISLLTDTRDEAVKEREGQKP